MDPVQSKPNTNLTPPQNEPVSPNPIIPPAVPNNSSMEHDAPPPPETAPLSPVENIPPVVPTKESTFPQSPSFPPRPESSNLASSTPPIVQAGLSQSAGDVPPLISPPSGKRKLPKVVFGLIALVLLIIAIPAGIVLVQQQQELRNEAQEGHNEFGVCEATIPCFPGQTNASGGPELFCRDIGSSTSNQYMWVTAEYANKQCDQNQKGRISLCGGETWVCRGNSQGDWVRQSEAQPPGTQPFTTCEENVSCGTTTQNSQDPSKPLYCRNLGLSTQFEFRWVTQDYANQACNQNTKGSESECGGEKWQCDGSTWQKVFDQTQACEGSLIPMCGPYPNNKLNLTWRVDPPYPGGDSDCNIYIQAQNKSYRISTSCQGQQTVTSLDGAVNEGGGSITNDGIYQLVVSNGQNTCNNKIAQEVRLSCTAPAQAQPGSPSSGGLNLQCVAVKFYDSNGSLITNPSSQIKSGQTIRIAVQGSSNAQRAEIRINDGAWEVASLKNAAGEFYINKQVSAGQFKVEGKVSN